MPKQKTKATSSGYHEYANPNNRRISGQGQRFDDVSLLGPALPGMFRSLSSTSSEVRTIMYCIIVI